MTTTEHPIDAVLVDPDGRTVGITTEHSTPRNVIQALALVAGELPGIGKDSTADPKQGGYAYRGIEAITRAAQPLLAKYGVVFAPHRVTHREVKDIIVNQKPWTDERITILYRVYGPGGPEDYIEVEVPAIGRDNSDKGSNKCMTQAFKYALLQVLCVSDAKDDADHGSPEADAYDPEAPTSYATRERVAAIRALCHTLRETGEEVTESNDEGEVTILGFRLLVRSEEGNLVPGIVNSDADALIHALTAKVQTEAYLSAPFADPESPHGEEASEETSDEPCAICGSTRSLRTVVNGVTRCQRATDCAKRAQDEADAVGYQE